MRTSKAQIESTALIGTDVHIFDFGCTTVTAADRVRRKGAVKCTVPQNFKLRPKRDICFDLVKACEGVFLLCFLGQIVT